MDFTGLTQNRLTAYRRLPGFETFVFMILNTPSVGDSGRRV
jgi:hypothetical protein